MVGGCTLVCLVVKLRVLDVCCLLQVFLEHAGEVSME